MPTIYSSSYSVYPDTTYTPSANDFLPPFLVIKNMGQAPMWVNQAGGGFDAYKLSPGENVDIPIASGETFRPLLTSTELNANGAVAHVVGWL